MIHIMCWHGAEWLSLVAILVCITPNCVDHIYTVNVKCGLFGRVKIDATFGTGHDWIKCPKGSIEILS